MTVNRAVVEGATLDIELECRTWDWVRTAGVSAEELRRMLEDSVSRAEPPAEPA